jgi:hypothetical protein
MVAAVSSRHCVRLLIATEVIPPLRNRADPYAAGKMKPKNSIPIAAGKA